MNEGLIEVTLDGQKYRLRASEDLELVQAAAQLVNHHLEEVRKGSKASSPYQVSLLGALNLALRLKKAQKELDQFKLATSGEIQNLLATLEGEMKSIQPFITGAGSPP